MAIQKAYQLGNGSKRAFTVGIRILSFSSFVLNYAFRKINRCKFLLVIKITATGVFPITILEKEKVYSVKST